jgi:hypothetical protein
MLDKILLGAIFLMASVLLILMYRVIRKTPREQQLKEKEQRRE